METQLALVVPDQLEEIVKNSGLEIAEGEQIKQSYLPFLQQLANVQEQSTKINFSNPVELDEIIAKELRLKTVKIRTGASDLKDSRKRIHLLKGNLEQAAFNLIAASCKLAEDVFVNVEKAREIAESKRKAGLRQERFDELAKFGWQNTGIDLGVFEEKQYQFLLSGIKKEFDEKIATEKKAEEDRLAVIAEHERTKKDNERLQREAEAREKAMAEERRIQAAKLAEEQAKAKKGAEAREKIEKELQDKKAAEIKAQKEDEAKAAADLKAKQEADKKAAAAPDKEKLRKMLELTVMPEGNVSTEAGYIIESSIQTKFKAFKTWANQQIETL